MKPILDNLLALGRTRLIALGVTGLGIVLAMVFGLGAVMAPTFTPLYSGLSPAGASSVVDTLEQAGFRVDISAGGSTVSVPLEDVARARMALADRGLPDEGVPGWELFDDTSGLGMNSFMQRLNRLRALEGELARSIQTIDGIDAARVHLVLPEREAFSRERPEPSASVIVRARPSFEVGRAPAQSIRALVASAVPDLAPGRVTVLSASGETILSDDSDGAGEVTLESTRAGIEERMASNITRILTARVGAGNARVQVTADLSNEREIIRSQSYDPDQRVVRSTETRAESDEGQQFSQPETNVGDNLPDALSGDSSQPQSRSTSSNTEESVSYEIGNTQSEIVREPGEVRKISVAVLVNGIYNVAGDGTVDYQERSAEELDRLSRLVQSAIGYDETRGDSVSVDSLRFMDYSMDVGEPVGMSLGQTLTANSLSILRGLFAIAIVALVMLLGVRPLTRRLLPQAETAAASLVAPEIASAAAVGTATAMAGMGGGSAPMSGARSMVPAATIHGRSLPSGIAMPVAEEDYLYDPLRGAEGEFVRLSAVKGEVRRNRLSAIGELVQGEPDESLRVLRTWLAQEA